MNGRLATFEGQGESGAAAGFYPSAKETHFTLSVIDPALIVLKFEEAIRRILARAGHRRFKTMRAGSIIPTATVTLFSPKPAAVLSAAGRSSCSEAMNSARL